MTFRKMFTFLNTGAFLRNKCIQKRFCKYVSSKPLDSKQDFKEVEFHSSLADHWWDRRNPLHDFNLIRVPFIISGIKNAGIQHQAISRFRSNEVLKSVKILDVGCGGGVLSEALARTGADVVGIDPSKELIDVAKEHKKVDPFIANNLRYERTSIYEHEEKNKGRYDAVIVSEVIEHVSNKSKFLTSCIATLRIGGSIFITTPNKTFASKLLIVKLGEKLKFIPPGTHDFRKFITPEALGDILRTQHCTPREVTGILYNPLSGQFFFYPILSLMYAVHAVKLSANRQLPKTRIDNSGFLT